MDSKSSCNESVPDEVWIVTSPKAGSGAGRERVAAVADRLASNGLPCHRTDSLEELKHKAIQTAPKSWLVVAAGGDGTLAVVAERLRPTTPLVPMPMGTENLLARHFRCSSDVDQVVDTIVNGHDHRIDAGRATPCHVDGTPRGPAKLFLVMITSGFDAEVVRGVDLRRAGHVSRLSYAGPIWRAVRRYRFPPIHVLPACPAADDAVLFDPIPPAAWTMAFNLPCYAASIPIEPSAVDDDGQLNLVTLRDGSLSSGLRYLGALLCGRKLAGEDMHRRLIGSFRLMSESKVPFQLDGDYGGRLPVRVDTLPGRVCLRLPSSDRSRKLTA